MFNLFKKPEYNEVKVPEEKKKDSEPSGKTMYSVGMTDTNRVSLSMGYTEITMNAQGVQNLIDQLELFKQQIMDVNPKEETKDE